MHNHIIERFVSCHHHIIKVLSPPALHCIALHCWGGAKMYDPRTHARPPDHRRPAAHVDVAAAPTATGTWVQGSVFAVLVLLAKQYVPATHACMHTIQGHRSLASRWVMIWGTRPNRSVGDGATYVVESWDRSRPSRWVMMRKPVPDGATYVCRVACMHEATCYMSLL